MSDIRKPFGRPYVIVDGKPYFDLPVITAAIAKQGLKVLFSGPEALEMAQGITAVVKFLEAVDDKAVKEIKADAMADYDTGDRQS